MNTLASDDFSEITQLIAAARQRAVQVVNTALIDLYWQVGQTISRKIEAAANNGASGNWNAKSKPPCSSAPCSIR